ncbi:thermonuclease family protein [Aestuariivita boseongensis]|uniref:thermonuclease family protein n=1 Tax=Aestuariivita boseongensis TaxID=1470562 RepID=UPI0006821977|nr:thermonuclease family protein [Aestuariivita boseongensis]
MLRFCLAVLLSLSPLTALADVSGAVRVIDADTWDVGGTRVRLFGIDAPERDQTCTRPSGEVWECGLWSSAQTRAEFDGAWAQCEALDRDRYGRVVARCAVRGRDVARVLVQSGWAYAYRRYSMDYDLDEKGAAVRGVGLHGSSAQAPAEFRAERRAPETPDRTCAIKGNISASGKRIYHMPGQEHYRQTQINPAKGERWFCSEAQAQAAGWRRARR